MNNIISIAVLSIIFIAIDSLWLGVIARSFYSKGLGFVMDTLRLFPALLTYILMSVGLYVFVYTRFATEGLGTLLLYSFIFGALVYAVYDLTNLSFISKWPLSIAVVDVLWGGVVSTLSVLVFHYVSKLVGLA